MDEGISTSTGTCRIVTQGRAILKNASFSSYSFSEAGKRGVSYKIVMKMVNQMFSVVIRDCALELSLPLVAS